MLSSAKLFYWISSFFWFLERCLTVLSWWSKLSGSFRSALYLANPTVSRRYCFLKGLQLAAKATLWSSAILSCSGPHATISPYRFHLVQQECFAFIYHAGANSQRNTTFRASSHAMPISQKNSRIKAKKLFGKLKLDAFVGFHCMPPRLTPGWKKQNNIQTRFNVMHLWETKMTGSTKQHKLTVYSCLPLRSAPADERGLKTRFLCCARSSWQKTICIKLVQIRQASPVENNTVDQ